MIRGRELAAGTELHVDGELAAADRPHCITHAEAVRLWLDGVAVRESFRARLAALEHSVRTGALVDADEVKAAAFNRARLARDALYGMADRVTPEISGRSVEEIRDLLRAEVQQALATMEGSTA